MPSAVEPMLLDRYLADYDRTEVHAVVVDADPDRTWQAIRRSDLGRSGVVRLLLELRSLPNRLQRLREGRSATSARPPLTLDDMARAGFVQLGERPGREIVLGTIAQPWNVVTEKHVPPQVGPDEFAAFDSPGYVKVAFNICIAAYSVGRTLITTETRTAATDDLVSRRRFARYWLLIGPFSAIIRRAMLRLVKADAENPVSRDQRGGQAD